MQEIKATAVKQTKKEPMQKGEMVSSIGSTRDSTEFGHDAIYETILNSNSPDLVAAMIGLIPITDAGQPGIKGSLKFRRYNAIYDVLLYCAEPTAGFKMIDKIDRYFNSVSTVKQR